MFLDGSQILQSHDPKLVLLAAAICALGSFITLFLFAQAREMHGQGRGGWLFLAGFAAGAVMWTTHFVALLAFQPGHQHRLRSGADRRRVLRRGAARHRSASAVAAYGPGASGFVGGGILGLSAVAMHFTAMASLRIGGMIDWNPILLGMGVVLCVTCATLAVGRARDEGRNVQFIAPLFLAAGICIMHFVGMAAIEITPSTTIPIPPKTIDPTVLGYFVAAMVLLLVGTGAATTLIARGARKEAQTQLRNIADASVEGLILTDGTAILDFNESVRGLVGPIRAAAPAQHADLGNPRLSRRPRRSTASRRSSCRDSGPDPRRGDRPQYRSRRRGAPHLRRARPARAPRRRAAHPLSSRISTR